MAASSMISGISNAYGYFQYVLMGFALLFIFLDIDVITCYHEMKNLDNSIISADPFKTDKVKQRGQIATLRQEFAMNFKKRILCHIIFKTVLSAVFMCQFFYAFELAERKAIDEKHDFSPENRLVSQNVINTTIITSALFLFSQRFIEAILFLFIKGWVQDKSNFKVKSSKTKQVKPNRSSKSHSSDLISCRSSTNSDGSTEASQCLEDDCF